MSPLLTMITRIHARYRRWRTLRIISALSEAQLKDIGWPHLPQPDPVRHPDELPFLRPRGRGL